MVDILNNKESFLRTKPHMLCLILIILLSFIILLVLSIKIKVYDNYETKGIYTCNNECYLEVVVPSNIFYQEIEVNKKLVSFKVLSEDLEIDKDNMISYIKLKLDLDSTFKEQEIVDVNFYYNKQRIITKIKEKI